jgi:hypothetical protein
MFEIRRFSGGLSMAIPASLFRVSSILFGLALLADAPGRADGPFRYYTITPCRLADTRNANGLNGGPKMANFEIRSFKVQGLCGIPAGAKAVALNVTVVGTAAAGYLTLFPNGVIQPVVSNINFSANEPALGNGATVPLGDAAAYPNADLRIYDYGSTHVTLDAFGYFQ